MAFGSGGDDDRGGPVEYVEFGGRRRWPRAGLSWIVLACLIVAAIVVAVIRHDGKHGPPVLPPVSASTVGHPLLGIKAGWELFGLDQNGVVSIQLASGHIVSTTLPPALGSGPVSFIVGPDVAIVRPLDNVPGYYIRDGDPAQPLTGILAKGGLLLPGPTSAQAWDSAGSSNSLVLVGTDGQPTSTRITLPNPGWPSQSAMSDGRGDVLVASDSGSQYDAGPHFLRLVGVLLSAVGPTRWLAMDCPSGHCRNVVFNPKTGTERTLPGPPVHLLTWPWPAYPGSVAPDGQTAAVVADSGNGHVVLEELNLTTGTVTRLAVPVSENTSSQTMAWSPDSKWLFVAAANGSLLAVRTHTHRVQHLGVPGDFSQLALRT